MPIFTREMKYCLYIDTSGKRCEVILFDRDHILAAREEDTQANHGRLINRFIGEVLQEARASFRDIAVICVLNGPGSYTGLRISLSTAKGICYAWDIPLVLVHKLSLLNAALPESKKEKPASACILKARENEYFIEITGREGEVLQEASLLYRDEVDERLNDTQAAVFTDQADLAMEFPGIEVLELTQEDKIAHCQALIEGKKFADLFLSEPFYMKNVHINKINKL